MAPSEILSLKTFLFRVVLPAPFPIARPAPPPPPTAWASLPAFLARVRLRHALPGGAHRPRGGAAAAEQKRRAAERGQRQVPGGASAGVAGRSPRSGVRLPFA